MVNASERASSSATSTGALDVGGKLTRLGELAREFGAKHISDEASNLGERLREGRFYLACIGQFKRGKSTLLNALLEDGLLPTGVVPITAVPTVVRYGESRSARVRFQGGSWTSVAPEELVQYVSEEHNPENAKQVAGVEVFVPSPLLADGMCLVDTPGLGSIFAGNTAATQAFVPHIDAAIIVLGADPPIAGAELALVEEVAKHVRNLVVVLNKADRTSEEERRVAVPFTRKTLEQKLKRPMGPIYEVSAFCRMNKHQTHWDWDALVAALRNLVEESGRTLVRSAGERGLRRLGEEMLSISCEEREALLRPMEESERRIAAMRETIADTERSLREIGYLFMAEKHRLSDLFLDGRQQFLKQIRSSAREQAREAFHDLPRRYGPRFRRDAMAAAQAIAAEQVLPWLALEQARAEEEYRHVAERFVNSGNEFLQKLAESKIPELSRMPNALNSEKGFRVTSHFRFEELINIARPASPVRYFSDVSLGLIRAFGVIEYDALEFFDYLLEMNCTRVQSDLIDRVEQSQGQLEAEIRKLLYEVTRMATTALAHAREARSRGATTVEEKLQRISAAEKEIRGLLAA
jgi:GTPase Era involved in 16S rRNA processing